MSIILPKIICLSSNKPLVRRQKLASLERLQAGNNTEFNFSSLGIQPRPFVLKASTLTVRTTAGEVGLHKIKCAAKLFFFNLIANSTALFKSQYNIKTF